ncbi:DUF3575 domain-containing protein [Bacteroides thetaiotaomicron]|nr:DUF3575 domain-containing protein [Bacteroides thetaiotaomicron]
MKRFIFLLLLLGCLDAYSQKAAIRVNALSAIDGAFGGGISYAIGNKSTVELTGSLRPWEAERRICQPLLAPATRIQILDLPEV